MASWVVVMVHCKVPHWYNKVLMWGIITMGSPTIIASLWGVVFPVIQWYQSQPTALCTHCALDDDAGMAVFIRG